MAPLPNSVPLTNFALKTDHSGQVSLLLGWTFYLAIRIEHESFFVIRNITPQEFNFYKVLYFLDDFVMYNMMSYWHHPMRTFMG